MTNNNHHTHKQVDIIHLEFPPLLKSATFQSSTVLPSQSSFLSNQLMASLTNILTKPPIPSSLFTSPNPIPNPTIVSSAKPKPTNSIPLFFTRRRSKSSCVRHLKASGVDSGSAPSPVVKEEVKEKVKRVHSAEELDEALRDAKDRLVVLEYAATHSEKSNKMYPYLVELSRTCNDVVFLMVMGDESDKTQDLCKRENVEKVPHFTFYKSMEKIHEEEGIGPDQLMGDVLYYGDNHSGVVQLHGREDVERLIEDHRVDGKLIVLDVGLKHCGPCVKVYPLVLKLSKSMSDTVTFARMNGDENDSCMEFLKDMDVIEVPTFLFIRNGEIRGRYVGSGKGELIGEILRYQGVLVT